MTEEYGESKRGRYEREHKCKSACQLTRGTCRSFFQIVFARSASTARAFNLFPDTKMSGIINCSHFLHLVLVLVILSFFSTPACSAKISPPGVSPNFTFSAPNGINHCLCRSFPSRFVSLQVLSTQIATILLSADICTTKHSAAHRLELGLHLTHSLTRCHALNHQFSKPLHFLFASSTTSSDSL